MKRLILFIFLFFFSNLSYAGNASGFCSASYWWLSVCSTSTGDFYGNGQLVKKVFMSDSEGNCSSPSECWEDAGGCPDGQELFQGLCVPVCPSGSHRDFVSGQCQQDQEEDNCPPGQTYSNATQQCEEYEDDDCPNGDFSGDPRDGECQECPTGEWKNPETQQCERQCPFPLEWSLKYGQCVERDVCEKGDYSGDPTDRKCGCEPPKVNFLELCLDECTGGTIRNPKTGICEENCPQGYSSVTLNGVTACFQEGERGGCDEGSSAGLLNGVAICVDGDGNLDQDKPEPDRGNCPAGYVRMTIHGVEMCVEKKPEQDKTDPNRSCPAGQTQYCSGGVCHCTIPIDSLPIGGSDSGGSTGGGSSGSGSPGADGSTGNNTSGSGSGSTAPATGNDVATGSGEIVAAVNRTTQAVNSANTNIQQTMQTEGSKTRSALLAQIQASGDAEKVAIAGAASNVSAAVGTASAAEIAELKKGFGQLSADIHAASPGAYPDSVQVSADGLESVPGQDSPEEAAVGVKAQITQAVDDFIETADDVNGEVSAGATSAASTWGNTIKTTLIPEIEYTSSNCTLGTVELYGVPMVLSFCDYVPFLSTLGNIIYFFALIGSTFVFIRILARG